MSSPTRLRGMAWDHPRAINPLTAISEEWSRDKAVTVEWDARPLKDFEDQPLEELATEYDLVLIDYPFVGFAARSGHIVPVNNWVEAAYLADQSANSVGPSYASYAYDGRQWALAIDSACQVSAVRHDLWKGGCSLPATWEEVAKLARNLRRARNRVAVALKPNHAYCAFLSVGITIAGDGFWPAGGRVDRAAAVEALDFLRRLAEDLHPVSGDADPITISDRMSTTDEILYVPLMFGYSSYARLGFRPHTLRFGNAPSGRSGAPGSVLGGVGIALSAHSANAEMAADLARCLVSPEVQADIYVTSGGQPGHAAAWDSPSANECVGNFFLDTRLSMDHAFVRPRVPGHRRFQKLAGDIIHRYIWLRAVGTATACLSSYNELSDALLDGWGEDAVPHRGKSVSSTA